MIKLRLGTFEVTSEVPYLRGNLRGPVPPR
jgi:hypothetical protein